MNVRVERSKAIHADLRVKGAELMISIWDRQNAFNSLIGAEHSHTLQWSSMLHVSHGDKRDIVLKILCREVPTVQCDTITVEAAVRSVEIVLRLNTTVDGRDHGTQLEAH